jgi:chromosome segregation ATPase
LSDSSLWKKKELSDYKRKFNSELPPYYNFEEVRQAHQSIEATVLEYWELLHPVIQDFITSWFHQWSTIKKESEGLVTEKQQKASMLERFKKSTASKIELLNNETIKKKPELEIINQKLQEKEEEIKKLEGTDQENKLGVSELRSELEKQLAELNLKLSEMQNRFENTQSQVTGAFEKKVMLFESEVASIREQVMGQEQKIRRLQYENQQIKLKNQKLQLFEDKIAEIIDIVTSISIRVI